MPNEIEVKFLLRDFDKSVIASKEDLERLNVNSIDELFKKVVSIGNFIEQYYLAFDKVPEILKLYNDSLDPNIYTIGRIRKEVSKKNIEYVLCFKSSGDYVMGEEEFQIISSTFEDYKKICMSNISKYRLKEPVGKYKAEVDVFQKNKSEFLNNLILTEVEVKTIEEIPLVPKFGLDVSKVKNYKNFGLSLMNNKWYLVFFTNYPGFFH